MLPEQIDANLQSYHPSQDAKLVATLFRSGRRCRKCYTPRRNASNLRASDYLEMVLGCFVATSHSHWKAPCQHAHIP